MKNLFLPYELAKLAKEKGFNEPCLGWFDKDNDFRLELRGLHNHTANKNEIFHIGCSAPLYQQIVDWFRDKHKIEINVFSVLPFIYGYSFEYMEAWSKEDKDISLHMVDQLLYSEKKETISKPVKKWKELKYTYEQAQTKAIEEAFNLI